MPTVCMLYFLTAKRNNFYFQILTTCDLSVLQTHINGQKVAALTIILRLYPFFWTIKERIHKIRWKVNYLQLKGCFARWSQQTSNSFELPTQNLFRSAHWLCHYTQNIIQYIFQNVLRKHITHDFSLTLELP